MFKLEFGQQVVLTAGNFKDRKGGDASIQAGTGVWTVAASDVDGNPVEDVTIEVNPDLETEATVKHSGTRELTGIATFRADGDTDLDEESAIVLTASFVVDSLNAATGELTAGTPADSE